LRFLRCREGRFRLQVRLGNPLSRDFDCVSIALSP
jgi:hypothetical protein